MDKIQLKKPHIKFYKGRPVIYFKGLPVVRGDGYICRDKQHMVAMINHSWVLRETRYKSEV